MKDIKQVTAFMAAGVELEEKKSAARSKKTADLTTAAAIAGAGAVGAIAATSERSGKMAAAGGAAGILAWLTYNYFQKPTVAEASPVKVSTGNWVADRRISEKTLEKNYTDKAAVIKKAVEEFKKTVTSDDLARFHSLVSPKVKQALAVVAREELPAIPEGPQDGSHALLAQQGKTIDWAANMEARYAGAAGSSAGPGDTAFTQKSPLVQKWLEGSSTASSSGPGDSLFTQKPPQRIKPTIERANKTRTAAEQANYDIRSSDAVAKTDRPLIVQTQQGTINAIAQEIRKKTPRCSEPPTPGCMTDPEVMSMAIRIAENNARRARSGEPANWLTNLVTHGVLVKQLSLDWLLWRDLLTPLDTAPTGVKGRGGADIKDAWYKVRAEPPPPVGDIGGKGGGYPTLPETGKFDPSVSYVHQKWLDDCFQDQQDAEQGGYERSVDCTVGMSRPLRYHLAKDSPAYWTKGEQLAQLFTPWCCQPYTFRQFGEHPRKIVEYWMTQNRAPFNYKPSPGSTAWGSAWNPRGNGKYWGYDKYPLDLKAGYPLGEPAWRKHERIRRPNESLWTQASTLTDLREYYKTSYWLVWAGVVYCLHSFKSIPDWYRKHALFHGVPCPSKHMEETGRNFAACTGSDMKEAEELAHQFFKAKGKRLPANAFCPPTAGRMTVPVPTGIGASGFGPDIPRSKVYEMLSLVVKHTPVPGSIRPGDELRRYQRRLCDWPDTATGGYRPDFGLPPEWTTMIGQRVRPAVAKRNKRLMMSAKVVQTVCTAVASSVSGGAATAATAGASAAISAAMSATAGTVLNSVIKGAVNAASGMIIDMQNSLLEGRSIDPKHQLFRAALSIAGSAAGPVLGETLEGAKEAFQTVVKDLEESEVLRGLQGAWQHTWALAGDVSDQFNVVMGDINTQVDGFKQEIKEQGEAVVGGALNGLADPTFAALASKYSSNPDKYFSQSLETLQDKAVDFGENKLEGTLKANLGKRAAKWENQAVDLEQTARVLVDF